MSYAVAITKTQIPRAVVVREEWIYQFNVTLMLNTGFKKNKECKIFFSRDLNKSADFGANMRCFFDENVDGCYNANLYRFFGK